MVKKLTNTFITFRHLACEEDRYEEAKLLVDHGAKLSISNADEKTPLDLASKGLAVMLQRLVDSLTSGVQNNEINS